MRSCSGTQTFGLGEQLVLRECYTLRPNDSSLHGIRMAFDNAHYVSCIVMGDFAFPNAEVESLFGRLRLYLAPHHCVQAGGRSKHSAATPLHARRTMVGAEGRAL